MRLTIHMLFLSKRRHVGHSVPSSWRDAISLGSSNFHFILVILLAASLCLVSTDNVSVIIGNLGKVFIYLTVLRNLEVILTFHLFLIHIVASFLLSFSLISINLI